MGLLETHLWEKAFSGLERVYISSDEEASDFLEILFYLRVLCPFDHRRFPNQEKFFSESEIMGDFKYRYLSEFMKKSEVNFLKAQLAFGPDNCLEMPSQFPDKNDFEFKIRVMKNVYRGVEEYITMDPNYYIFLIHDFVCKYEHQEISKYDELVMDYLTYVFTMLEYQNSHEDLRAEMSEYVGRSEYGNFFIGFTDKLAWNSVASLVYVRLLCYHHILERIY